MKIKELFISRELMHKLFYETIIQTENDGTI